MRLETVTYAARGDGVATIAMDQPGTRNALSDALLADLLSAFAAARDDDAIRCVVLASTHPTTFSAGGDLQNFAADRPLAHKHVGVFPFMIAALIARNVPRKKMTELLLLGERVDAAEAARLGLVNRVVPAEELDAAVADWAGRLAAKSPLLMRMGKDALWRQQDMAFEDALGYLRAQLAIAMATEDIQEGVKAFFEQREPVWTGR
jgi:enoyl-CoA hydratase/carnithine racemase